VSRHARPLPTSTAHVAHRPLLQALHDPTASASRWSKHFTAAPFYGDTILSRSWPASGVATAPRLLLLTPPPCGNAATGPTEHALSATKKARVLARLTRCERVRSCASAPSLVTSLIRALDCGPSNARRTRHRDGVTWIVAAGAVLREPANRTAGPAAQASGLSPQARPCFRPPPQDAIRTLNLLDSLTLISYLPRDRRRGHAA